MLILMVTKIFDVFLCEYITVVEKEYLRNVISGRTNDPGIILYNMNEIIERLGIMILDTSMY